MRASFIAGAISLGLYTLPELDIFKVENQLRPNSPPRKADPTEKSNQPKQDQK